MYTTEDILNRLSNGESSDAIATEIANNLNEAIKRHKAQMEAENAKNAKAKEEKLQTILDEMAAWVQEFYPDSSGTKLKLDAADIIKSIDTAMSAIDSLFSISVPTTKTVPKEKERGVEPAVAETLEHFIKKMGW